MYIKNEIKGEIYQKLIEYAFETCDYAILHIDDGGEYIPKKIRKIIKENNIDVEKLYNLLLKMKNPKNMEKNETQEYKILCDAITYNLVPKFWTLQGILLAYLHDRKKKEFLDEVKDSIIEKQSQKDGRHILYTIKLKLSEKVKSEILKRNSVYDWKNVQGPEQLKFVRDDDWWLESYPYEEDDAYCVINAKSEEEKCKLENFGIVFDDNEYDYSCYN